MRTTGKTGVEMEALTAVSVAALTVYDMCKAVDRGMRIEDVRLVRKTRRQERRDRAGVGGSRLSVHRFHRWAQIGSAAARIDRVRL